MSEAGRTLEWVRLPTKWIRFDRGLHRFGVTLLGQSVTALKLYLAIACEHLQLGIRHTGGVLISYSELENGTGAARAMIGPSLSMLEPQITIARGGGRRANEYSVAGFGERAGWAPLPARHILRTGTLNHFSPRSRCDLDALKLYLVLLAFRDNQSGFSNLSYDKITEYTNTPRNRIRSAISKLFEERLVHVVSAHQTDFGDSSSAKANAYLICGLWRRGPGGGPPADYSGLAFESV